MRLLEAIGSCFNNRTRPSSVVSVPVQSSEQRLLGDVVYCRKKADATDASIFRRDCRMRSAARAAAATGQLSRSEHAGLVMPAP
jgi:hypothetical protein